MKKTLYFIMIIVFIFSCTEDESGSYELKEFNVSDVSNTTLIVNKTVIDKNVQKIYVFFDNDLSGVSFPITISVSTNISKGASTSIDNNDQLIFNSADQVNQFDIIAENGNTSTWSVFLVHKQLQNSDFETWFTTQGFNGYSYEEVGRSIETSAWATANLGTSTYFIYGSKPITTDNNTVVQIKTDSVFTLPITSGTLFTGYFYLNGAIANPGNPKKATLFGTPFISKPTAFSVKYKYTAGTYYKQASLKDVNNILGGFDEEGIDGEDKCAIYAILENRDGNPTIEIARAELYSASTNDAIDEITIPFVYTSQLEPTHITVVFSSSKDGDLWRGAVGSTLTIDDLEFIYE